MLEWFSTAASWLPWVGGISGILLAVAAYLLGAKAVVEALAPILKGVSEFIVEFFKTVLTGLKETFDSFAQIVFLGTVIVCSAWYFNDIEALRKCEDALLVQKSTVKKLQAKSKPSNKAPSKVATKPKEQAGQPPTWFPGLGW